MKKLWATYKCDGVLLINKEEEGGLKLVLLFRLERAPGSIKLNRETISDFPVE